MKKIVLISMAIMATSMLQAQGLQYPKAEKDGTVDEYFGVDGWRTTPVRRQRRG